MKITLSIVIVTYKSLKYINNCLRSINQFNDLPNEEVEIIIVDNSPAEDFEELLRFLPNDNPISLKVIHNSSNGGYGQGNNIGIAKSSGEIILIMNPDIELSMPLFSKAKDHFRDNNLVVLGGKQIGGRNFSFYIRQEFDFHIITAPMNLLLNKYNYYNEKFMFLSGALLFIRKQDFIDLGGFDENLFLYCEESDITNRILNSNKKTFFDKELRYNHLIELREASPSTFKTLIKSNAYYFNKFGFNMERFINQKVLSLKILSFLYLFINKKKHKKFIEQANIYKETYKSL